MDVLYIGSLALFAALTFALIAGCERLASVKQTSAHGVPPTPLATHQGDRS
jgi:hypothetical protein